MSLNKNFKFVVSFFVTCMASSISAQQLRDPMLQDLNLDGRIEMLAFGDSITRGVGDFYDIREEVPLILPTPDGEAGYPLRLENILGVEVQNKGNRGESLSTTGIFRFANTVSASVADYVIISEGVNDVFVRATTEEIKTDLQAMINMTRAMGKEPMIVTIPVPCCNRAGSIPFVDSYNNAYRDLARLNNILIADVGRAFTQTCTGSQCFLFNLPEGLHPNTRGYDAMAETIIAAFYGIDLLGPGGSELLAQALGVPTNSIVVQSAPAPAPTPAPLP